MKNLLDKGSVEKLVERVEQLQPGTKAIWGTMTATEMLLHCNMVSAYLLTAPPPGQKKTSTKELMARWFILYIKPNFPKGIKGPKQVQTKGIVKDDAFEETKQAFIELLRKFPEHKEPIRHRHPYFGVMNSKEWGRTAWKHTDHHLRQFGV